MEKILILGGSGYLGRNIHKNLIHAGYDVLSIGKSSKASNIDNYVSLNLTEKQNWHLLFEYVKHYDVVINCIGYVDHSPLNKASNVIQMHFELILHLLLNIEKFHIKHFIQLGSSEEYGNIQENLTESIRESPITPYGLAKTATTQLLEMAHKNINLPTTTLRLFLVYGLDQSINRFIPQIFKGCLSGEPFPVSKGEQIRDFLYVHDFCELIKGILLDQNTFGKTYNVGYGQGFSIRQVVEQIVEVCGSGKPSFGEIPYRDKENMCLVPCLSKLKNDVNWAPTIDLKSGLIETYDYLKST
jgi:nucleoside-diphosphate-sugar epimerase